MTRRGLILAAATLLLAFAALAEEPEQPDYSKPKLRFIFRDYLEDPQGLDARMKFELNRWGWKFRWMPIMLGATNAGGLGVASPISVIDPFYMTGTAFPETKETYRPAPNEGLSLQERRFRRDMIRITREANERDVKP